MMPASKKTAKLLCNEILEMKSFIVFCIFANFSKNSLGFEELPEYSTFTNMENISNCVEILIAS